MKKSKPKKARVVHKLTSTHLLMALLIANGRKALGWMRAVMLGFGVKDSEAWKMQEEFKEVLEEAAKNLKRVEGGE